MLRMYVIAERLIRHIVCLPGAGDSNCCGGGGSAGSYMTATYAGGMNNGFASAVRIEFT